MDLTIIFHQRSAVSILHIPLLTPAAATTFIAVRAFVTMCCKQSSQL
jgi:hypothetical protein